MIRHWRTILAREGRPRENGLYFILMKLVASGNVVKESHNMAVEWLPLCLAVDLAEDYDTKTLFINRIMVLSHILKHE